MARSDFVHLHTHTEYSMLDGAASNERLFAEVARQGQPAVAMTDHGNMFGAYEFFQLAKNYDGDKNPLVKPIIGVEAYVAPSSRFKRVQEFWGRGRGQAGDPDAEGGKDVSGGGRYTHMTMWAKNPTGLHNLFRLSSLASYEGYYMKPRMDRELISQYSEGVIGSTGCPSGEIQTRLRLGQFDEACEAAAAYQEIFGRENYFCELMDHGVPIEREVRPDLLRLAKKLDIPLLATNDSHYVTEDQADAHDSLLCVGVGRNKDDPNRFRFNGSGYYIKTSDEMRSLFPDHPEACDNTLALAEMIEPYDEVFSYVDRMPQFDVPEGETQESWLRTKLKEGLDEKFGPNPPQEVLDRVRTELKTIEPLGFSSYFLVVSDICNAARGMGVPVGPGRGSAAGSMVAYLTGIIQVNPLEHDLLFERFLNPERVNPPDIDLDFDDRQRDKVIDYVTHKYGEEYTSQVNTFGKIKAKNAVKDANRILGYPFALGDKITKAMPPDVQGKSVALSKIFDPDDARYPEGGEFRALYDENPDVHKVVDTARGIEGMIRGTGVHACAFILSSAKLLDLVPMHKRDKDGMIIAGFAYPQLEEMGLMKMDFLGLRNLGIMDHCVKIIKANRGEDVVLGDLPLDNRNTYELLSQGDTLGVFQLDGTSMRSLLRLMRPTSFDDIIALIALYRPGPMGANSHINYAERKNGRQEITPIHPELEEPLKDILAPTYGLIVYQEQIMQIARTLAGYSLGQADLLRRAMGKKKKYILDQNFAPFQAGMREHGYSDQSIQTLWDVMVPFAGYAFNKSHAAGYALVSYWTAYLKANYPAEYGAALLTSVGDDKDKMALYLADMRAQHINVLPPDVNASSLAFTAVGTDIRFGLGAIRNVGEHLVDKMIEAREEQGPAGDFFEFLDHMPLEVCNKRAIESLIKAGAFDSMGHSRRGLMQIFEPAVDAVIDLKRNEANGQDDLFGMGGAAEPAQLGVDRVVPTEDWDRRTKLAFERDMLGLYVSDHPLHGLESALEAERDISIASLIAPEGPREGTYTIAGMVTQITRRTTKNGDVWASITVEDLDASVTVACFPKVYQRVEPLLGLDTILKVRGRVRERDDTAEVSASDVWMLDLAEAGHAPLTIALRGGRCTPGVVADLRGVLRSHPGASEVRLRLQEGRQTTTFRLADELKVTTDQPLMADLKALLGPSCIPGR